MANQQTNHRQTRQKPKPNQTKTTKNKKMKELIKIRENNGQQAVSARELYDFLGYDKSQWARWYTKNIVENEFAVENEDYQTFDIMSSGNRTKDFALSIDFAKKISMMSRTERGENARKYFIECEKKLKQYCLPQSFPEALRQLADTTERLQEQQKQLQEQAPKVAYYDDVLQSEGVYLTTQVAKELGLSATALHRKLNKCRLMFNSGGTWVLYAHHQDKGYTKTKTYAYTDSNGTTKTRMQTVWTERGRQFLHSLFL